MNIEAVSCFSSSPQITTWHITMAFSGFTAPTSTLQCPCYENQAAYWPNIPSVPACGALLQWPCPIARGVSDLGKFYSGVMPAFLLGKGHDKGPEAGLSAVIKAQICARRCLSKCGHAACTARTNQPP